MNSEIQTQCVTCGSKVRIEIRKCFDTRFGIKGGHDICQCLVCGLKQTMPSPTYLQIKDLYEAYYNFRGDKRTAYSGIREFFFASFLYRLWMAVDGDISFHNFKGSGRLLDVGCNEGRGLKIYQQNGFDAEGLEINECAAVDARQGGFKVYTERIENFRPKKAYDVVVLTNVLEHSLQPKAMLAHVARILKPGGHLWISCPNVDSWQRLLFGKYWINWHVPFHIVHFSQSTLTNILQKTGFEIQEIRQESPALWVAQSLIVRLFSKPGKPTYHLRSPLLVASLMLLAKGLLFPILALSNRIGRGDCLVIVAKKI